MNCPKCSGDVYRKDGIIRGLQRYLCKQCCYRYTVKQRSGTGSLSVRRKALELYLEGLGLRSIGRILNFSNVTILNWIRSFGEKIDNLQSKEPSQVVEIDEMHSYIKSKKKHAGYGLLLIDIEKDLSIVSWEREAQKQVCCCGTI